MSATSVPRRWRRYRRTTAPAREHKNSREAQLLNARDPSETGDGENPDCTNFLDLKAYLDAVVDAAYNELAQALEQKLFPALKGADITTFHWDRVKDFRNQLVILMGRLQKTREMVEHLPDVEMHLGAHLSKIDGMLNRISTLSEYLANVEENAKIRLDNKMNRLRMKAILSTATLVMGAFGLLIALMMI